MAENSARADTGRAAGVAEPDDDLNRAVPPTGRDLVEALVDRARLRIRWVGAGRIAGAAGATLVLAGLGWWLLRSPTLPTEAALPRAPHDADPAVSVATTVAGVPPGAAITTEPSAVLVHVAGAVNQPGVYELAPGQRVADAVAAAGGATVDADPDLLNLAAPVADGDRIEVPVAGSSIATAGSGHTHATEESSSSSGPIDLNEATASELEQLPGIGPATAAAIVEHRTQHGPFATVDDLLDVPGIGPAKLDAIRDAVTT